LIEQLSHLMMRYLEELALEIENQPVELQPVTAAAKTTSFLADAERLILSASSRDLNVHQLIHIQELTKNCLGAIIATLEALLVDAPFEGTDRQMLELHPDLCGLLQGVDEFWGHSRHQRDRVPYAPARVGREVTYEEIANLFRTSQVNIRRIEHDGCFRKLRTKLRDFRI
jgi:hypothetical protein